MSHAVHIEPHVLADCPDDRVVERGDDGELVQVVQIGYECRPGQTLADVAAGYAALRNLRVVTP
jgi:hypothetical protein